MSKLSIDSLPSKRRISNGLTCLAGKMSKNRRLFGVIFNTKIYERRKCGGKEWTVEFICRADYFISPVGIVPRIVSAFRSLLFRENAEKFLNDSTNCIIVTTIDTQGHNMTLFPFVTGRWNKRWLSEMAGISASAPIMYEIMCIRMSLVSGDACWCIVEREGGFFIA